VSTGRQPELQAHALQQPNQLLALWDTQVSAEIVLEPGGELKRASEQLTSGNREVQLAGASIEGVVPAFEQRPSLQRVDERDHATGRYLQTFADGLLRLAFGYADRAQQSELPRLEC